MITYNQLIYDIWEIMSGGRIADDSKFDPRQISFWLNNQRALLVRNDLNKGRNIDPDLIQDLGCVEMEVVDRAECCDIGIDCAIIRTKLRIPNPLVLNHLPLFTRIGRIDKVSESYNVIPYAQIPFVGNGRFNKKMKFAFYRDGRIYIKLTSNNLFTKAIKHINIQGVFEDPSDIGRFTTCSGIPCFSEDDKYPISAWMVDYIKEGVMRNAGLTNITAPDKENNASSDEVMIGRMK